MKLNLNKLVAKFKANLHIVFLVFLCLIPVIWFIGKGDILITGLDTNFPLDPKLWFMRRFFVWNGVNNVGVNFSSSTAGLFFHFVQLVPYLLGLSLKYVEIFSLVFWFTAIVTSSYILSKIVSPDSKIAQIVFVCIYSLNTYLFNTWENVKVSNLSLVAALPLFVAIIYNWHQKVISPRKAIIFLCLSSILASGAGINPAYFSVIALVIIIQSIIFKSLKIGIISLLILIGVNLFWILPLSEFLLTIQTGTLSDLGFTNWLQSLSANTSIINVARLQGAWDWYALDSYGMPQYLPYTLNYLYKLPFIVFSFAVPFLSFISLLFVNKVNRTWYIYFGMLALLGIFLGVGAHSPTGNIFLFLTSHLPFFSFYRSPWYIFTPILALSYAALTSLFFNKFPKLKIVGILFIVCYGLYNYPLINGKIFRPDRDGFYIKFPNYVWETKDYLSARNDNGRIISYPDDQLESFKWGYKGTESILSLFSDQEIITPSFNPLTKNFSDTLNIFYSQIKREQYRSALSTMNLLGANEIFYKKDIQTLAPKIADNINQLVDIKNIGNWVFMKSEKNINGKLFLANNLFRNLNNNQDFIYVSSLINPKTIVVNDGDTEIEKINALENVPIIAQIKDNIFEINHDGNFIFAIEKNYINKNEITALVDSKIISSNLFSDNDSLITIGPIKLQKGKHTFEVKYPEALGLLVEKDYSFSSKDLNLKKEELPSDLSKTLVAYNSTNDPKRIKLSVNNFNPFLRYVISFDYKYLYGSVPVVDVIQSAPSSPVKSEPVSPGSSFDWDQVSKVFIPVETDSKLEVFIKLPPNKLGDKSKSYFENIQIKRVYDNRVFVIEEPQENKMYASGDIKYTKVNPTKYKVSLSNIDKNSNGVILSFLETYSDGWELNVPATHFSINGYANAWYIPGNTDRELIISYKPQRIFILGLLISITTIIGIFIIQGLHIKNVKKLY